MVGHLSIVFAYGKVLLFGFSRILFEGENMEPNKVFSTLPQAKRLSDHITAYLLLVLVTGGMWLLEAYVLSVQQ